MFQQNLRSIDVFESGGFKVQQPVTDIRNIVERVNVRSGELVVLAGYNQSLNRIDTNSPFGKSAWWLGGSKKTSKQKTMMVIVIEPTILESK